MKRILSLLTFTLVLIIFLSSCQPDTSDNGKSVNNGNTGNSEQTQNGEDKKPVTKTPEDNIKYINNGDESDQEGDESGQEVDESDQEVDELDQEGDELDQEGVEVQVSVPTHVKQGSQFEITLQVKNNTSKEQELKEVKIDKEYLDAIAIIKTEPNYKNVYDSPFYEQKKYKKYEFQFPIGSQETTKFIFYAEAIEKGDYIPKFDVDTTYEVFSLHKEASAFID